MTFSNRQARALKAKLAHRHVKTRVSNGASIAYVEGWHVIAEANRIFGFDSWDRTTVSPVCLWSELQRGQTVCFYSTRVRIRVRAGGSVIIRDGIGTGIGRATSPEQAHEIALKAAETDATKRALATFGNPFGLALYDKDRVGVSKPDTIPIKEAKTPTTPKSPEPSLPEPLLPERSIEAAPGPLPAAYALNMPGDRPGIALRPEEFIASALERVPKLATVEALYAFWEANLPTFSALRRTMSRKDDDPVGAIVAALKDRARALGHKVKADVRQARPVANDTRLEQSDSAVQVRLAIPKEKRLRDKAHLGFVASLPCTICGRQPSHAHHLRFAQPRAMAMKVSDEFTVPLCAVHHDEVHRTGDERAWWARRGKIEPLKIAARLWEASRSGTTEALLNLQEEPAKSGSEADDAIVASDQAKMDAMNPSRDTKLNPESGSTLIRDRHSAPNTPAE